MVGEFAETVQLRGRGIRREEGCVVILGSVPENGTGLSK